MIFESKLLISIFQDARMNF